MEQFKNKDMINRSGKVWAGLFIVTIGALLLLKNLGLNLPDWLFSWSTFLIGLGLFIGFKRNFEGLGWFILIAIGSYFTLEEAIHSFDIGQLGLPILLLVIGIFLIVKPKRMSVNRWERRRNRMKNRFDRSFPYNEGEAFTATDEETKNTSNSSDYLDSVNIFGGSQQTVYSKNFKGGQVIAIFGGCDVNITQADFEGEIVIDVTAIFGGAKLIVPQGWEVKSEVTAILGGMDDKRAIVPLNPEQKKILILRGVAMFGGIEIKNF
ncbi:LiaF transmembrane domain-containing protein [Pedobacter montanisoli]|uniref:Cell wall-active antibiotics response protein n=1 Tax=Pedobacter montanisoli TaxID=2923277 RepID=A0ABS9ZZN2_9SPHI|nr:LiaF domain-containing protein [Pedobacter montanisoli]MCJ0743768.1 cell wall-active antibiotics response protein [Pedobacter montanisoli]